MARQARLPTYHTAARVLEGQKGSGLKLAGWTIARTAMIAPPMMIVGVDAKRAFLGATFASVLISLFTVLRLHSARNAPTLAGRRRRR